MTDLPRLAKTRPFLLRLWRIAALAALALLAGWQARRVEEHARPASVRLQEALRGVPEFLINVGGELRARGTWAVAIVRCAP